MSDFRPLCPRRPTATFSRFFPLFFSFAIESCINKTFGVVEGIGDVAKIQPLKIAI